MRFSAHDPTRTAALLMAAGIFGVSAPASKAQVPPGLVHLTVTPAAIRFPDESPDLFPNVEAVQNPVNIRVTLRGPYRTRNWILTVSAGGDLASPTSAIPIDHVRWTATGIGFRSGTLQRDRPVEVASGVGNASGSLTFTLRNSWNFAAGNYAQSLVYTLTVL